MCEKNPQKSLIDFSSPLQERLDTETLVPLVPSPQFKQVNKKQTVSLESELISAVGNISDEDNNPFDLVDHQTNLNARMLNDPFELAFYLCDEAQVPPCEHSSKMREDKENLDSSTASELVVLVSSFNDGIANQSNQSLGLLNERIFNLSDSSLMGIDNITDPCKELRISLSEISMNANVSSLLGKKTEFDNVGRKIDLENINLSLSEEDARDEGNGSLTSSDSKADDADDSDQALKAIIANRVSVCIQNALHQSRVSRGSFIVNAETTTDQSGLPTTLNTSYHLREYPQKEKSFTANARKTSFYETDKDPLIKYEWKPIQRRSIGSFGDTSYSSFNKPLLVAKNLRQSFTNLDPTNFNYSAQEIVKGVDRKNTSYAAKNSMKTESFMKYYEEKMKQTGINHGVTENGLKNLKNEVKRNDDRIPVTDMVTPDGLVREITDKEYGDDSVFLEANNVAFMFRSFTLPANGEDDDILTCKPQWETSYLNLPELSSDDDESMGNPYPEVHSKQKPPVEDLLNAKVGTRYSKEAQGPPDIVLQPLVPLEKNEMQLRIKTKQVQQLGKKGPMKAIVPLGNMVRTAGIEKKVFPHGSQDQTDVDSSPDFQPKTSAASSTIQDTPKTKGLKTAKGTAWKTDGGSKNKFGNRSFTSSSNPSPVPNLRRSSSLTSGIPALAAPAVSLKSQFLPQNAGNQQKSMPDQKSKSSSNVGRFSLPGFVATSTPAKKMSFTTPNKLLMKSLPSPIPVKGSKKNSPTEVPKNAKSENTPKNKSFDGSQQISNEKQSHNQSHSRSKSASNTCSSKLLQNRKGSPKEVTKSNAGKSFNLKLPSQSLKSPPELKVVPSGILKPLKINGQSHVGKQIVDAKKPVPIPRNEVKRTRPLLQMFSKLKVDKENMKPA